MTQGGTSQKKTFGAWLRAVPASVWVGLVITALMVTFIVQNRTTVSIYLLVAAVSAPMWATLLITWLIGVLVGLLLAWRRGHRRRQ